MCIGMGIPIPRVFPWNSHGNGSTFGLIMGMGIGMGIVLMGMGIAYFIGEKNKLPTGSVNSLLFLHSNMQ